MPKVKVPWLCSRSQPGIKVIIRDIRGHLLHTVTFLVSFFFSFNFAYKIPWCNQFASSVYIVCPCRQNLIVKLL